MAVFVPRAKRRMARSKPRNFPHTSHIRTPRHIFRLIIEHTKCSSYLNSRTESVCLQASQGFAIRLYIYTALYLEAVLLDETDFAVIISDKIPLSLLRLNCW